MLAMQLNSTLGKKKTDSPEGSTLRNEDESEVKEGIPNTLG
jgi:hypothetical protein